MRNIARGIHFYLALLILQSCLALLSNSIIYRIQLEFFESFTKFLCTCHLSYQKRPPDKANKNTFYSLKVSKSPILLLMSQLFSPFGPMFRILTYCFFLFNYLLVWDRNYLSKVDRNFAKNWTQLLNAFFPKNAYFPFKHYCI